MRKCWSCQKTVEADHSCKYICKSCNAARANKYYHEVVRPKLSMIDLKDKNKKSLEEARASGSIHYQSYTACKHGHISKRLVSSQQCCECLRIRKEGMRKSTASELAAKRRTEKHNKLRRMISKNLGRIRYKSLSECIHGHMGERLTSTGQCCECLSERVKETAYTYCPEASRRKNSKRRSREGQVKSRQYYKIISKRETFKLERFMRDSIRRLRLRKDRRRACDILGYTPEDLIKRIEVNFTDGMTWDNYGEWHIDHTKPISRFLSQGVSDPKIVNALSNLKPMWSFDNLSKGAKF